MTIHRAGQALLLAALLITAACNGDAQADSPTEEQAQEFVRVINVEVSPVAAREFTQTVPLTGVAEAMQDVLISAEEAGVVRRVVRDKGTRVRAGQSLLRLDDQILAAQVQTATAQAQLAREVWERRRALYEEDGIGSEVSYLEAKYGADQAEGNLKALQERLARTTITAPISGILDQRLVEVGTMVSPGTPVARVVQVDPIKILAGVPERFALDIATGAKASVRFDIMPDEVFEGTITYVGATVDQGSRTFPVELTMPNPGERIKPEMVANIEVVRQVLEEAIVIPQEAMVRVEDGYTVFVARGEGSQTVAEARPITLMATQGNEAVISDGLVPGDRLIVVGQQQVANGDNIRVVEGRAEERD
ncbi:MAG: efflux RND transporter periplasmic adaptor subunit [Gemmatimonadetes bacterium]|nr:efflux RND transporter periplasmic adaptor subunit [Gemmatimonadota bacterium]